MQIDEYRAPVQARELDQAQAQAEARAHAQRAEAEAQVEAVGAEDDECFMCGECGCDSEDCGRGDISEWGGAPPGGWQGTRVRMGGEMAGNGV